MALSQGSKGRYLILCIFIGLSLLVDLLVLILITTITIIIILNEYVHPKLMTEGAQLIN